MKKNRQLKRMLATLAALLLLMPMTAGAETINTVTSSEDLTKTSTVYVGEVVVDGVTQIKYLYSGNMSINSIVLDGLYGCLSGMVDGDYAALLDATRVFNSIYITTNTLALCNNPELIDAMDENWSSAQYVGTLYFPDKSVASESSSNLYDIDEGFKEKLDEMTEYRKESIDNIIDMEKSIVSHLGASAFENVYYTVEDGHVIKHVDTIITYDCEATTVIYTKVELTTGQTSSLLGDVNGDGSVDISDVTMLVDYILGKNHDSFIIGNANVNQDGGIDVADVTALVNIILNGGSTNPFTVVTNLDDAPITFGGESNGPARVRVR